MEEEKRVSPDAAEPEKKASESDSASSETPAAAANDSGDKIREELARLQAEVQTLRTNNEELKDRNLRVVAEMENFRRRTERDKADFAKYAISEFARDVLSVADNMRRAIEAVPKDAAAHPVVKILTEGVEVTEREMLKVLERYQVTRFDPLGEPFNPHLHDAMTKVDVPNVPAETVVQVIHAGYMIGERVLRPAAVIVAKGGMVEQPKPNSDGVPDHIPLGAMKIPDDAVSSSSVIAPVEPAHVSGHVDVQQTVFGRHLSGEKRRVSLSDEALAEERAPNFRRSRPAAQHDGGRHHPGGGGGAGGGGGQHKPASLHKPIIQKQE